MLWFLVAITWLPDFLLRSNLLYDLISQVYVVTILSLASILVHDFDSHDLWFPMLLLFSDLR